LYEHTPESGAKFPIVCSVILDLVGCLIAIGCLLELIPSQSIVAIAMLYLLSQTFFLIFIRKLSVFLDFQKMITRTNILLSFMLFSYCSAMVSMLTRNTHSDISVPANGVFTLSLIAIFFMYISLIEILRKAIDEMLETSSLEIS
jgi:hypothetical protein